MSKMRLILVCLLLFGMLSACAPAPTPTPTPQPPKPTVPAAAPTTMPSPAPTKQAPTTAPANTVAPTTAPTTAPVAQATTVMLSKTSLGDILTDAKGMTLYIYTPDKPGVSNCSGQCAVNWPPLTVTKGVALTVGPGITGKLATITRADGSSQVTYNDMPLYYWIKDTKPGDVTGQGVGNVWYVIGAAGPLSSTVMLSKTSLGDILTSVKGMTLYIYTPDKPGVSNCSGQCAVNWPPLTVTKGVAPTVGPGITGKLATITRADGRLQVTYNDMPLYYWIKDTKPGDVTGQGVGNVWYVIGAAGPLSSTVMLGKTSLGDILTGVKGMTLYIYKNDKPGQSTCVDQCAVNWPPLTVTKGVAPTVGPGITGKVATITRADGSSQVTYNDMPLYYWIKDTVPGDVTGQAVNNVWYVVPK